jgi:hypothetical protein
MEFLKVFPKSKEKMGWFVRRVAVIYLEYILY